MAQTGVQSEKENALTRVAKRCWQYFQRPIDWSINYRGWKNRTFLWTNKRVLRLGVLENLKSFCFRIEESNAIPMKLTGQTSRTAAANSRREQRRKSVENIFCPRIEL